MESAAHNMTRTHKQALNTNGGGENEREALADVVKRRPGGDGVPHHAQKTTQKEGNTSDRTEDDSKARQTGR